MILSVLEKIRCPSGSTSLTPSKHKAAQNLFQSGFFISNVSSTSILIPITIGISRWGLLKRDLKFLFIVIVASGLSNAISLFFVMHRLNSWPILNLFYLFRFIFLFLVFDIHLRKDILKIVALCFIFLAIINFSFVQQPFQFNTYSSYLASCIILILAILIQFKLMNDVEVSSIQNSPMFWVSFGTLIYFGGTLFLFLFNNLLVKYQPGNHQVIWVVHNILNISQNLFFAIGLWKSRQGTY